MTETGKDAGDWLDAATHRTPKWPLLGYAPGDYMGRCKDCNGRFFNMDKRAWQCLPCAVEATGKALVAERERCARIAEGIETEWPNDAHEIASAIRARPSQEDRT